MCKHEPTDTVLSGYETWTTTSGDSIFLRTGQYLASPPDYAGGMHLLITEGTGRFERLQGYLLFYFTIDPDYSGNAVFEGTVWFVDREG